MKVGNITAVTKGSFVIFCLLLGVIIIFCLFLGFIVIFCLMVVPSMEKAPKVIYFSSKAGPLVIKPGTSSS